jgi:sortase B
MLDENIELTNTDDNSLKSDGNENRILIGKKRSYRNNVLSIAFSIGFVFFASLLVKEIVITPYQIHQSIERTNRLHLSNRENDNLVTMTPVSTIDISFEQTEKNTQSDIDTKEIISAYDSNRDSKGRLLQFKDLLVVNEDVKGWISIPESNIDYVVMQSAKDDPDYYLTRDIKKQEMKAGSLFLDYKCSVEDKSQNLTIHGHNMTSTDNMFHYLTKFKELDYYIERPVFSFDTIFQNGQWKIFSVFITNGSSAKEEFFDYTRSHFRGSSDFLNHIYQLRIRSLIHINTVDINENDQILTLSTCSYEVKNYRTVIVARKIREGEDTSVDVDSVTINPEPLYPNSYYFRYGGKAPEFTETFEEALENGEIKWYTLLDLK